MSIEGHASAESRPGVVKNATSQLHRTWTCPACKAVNAIRPQEASYTKRSCPKCRAKVGRNFYHRTPSA